MAASDLTKHGIPDFLALVEQDPEGLGVEWNHVCANIQADFENGLVSQSDLVPTVVSASMTFLNSLQNFANAVGQQNAGQAVPASANLVAVNFTSSGATQVITGLLKASAQSGIEAATPIIQDAAKHFTGSLLSSVVGAAASGLAATGVGAAIGAGLSIASGIIGGLFGDPPPPPYQVGSCGLYDKPDIVVKYTWMYGDKSQASPIVDGGPNNPNWRSFPDPTNKNDSGWFHIVTKNDAPKQAGLSVAWEFGAHALSWQWAGNKIGHKDTWYACVTFPGDEGKRYIDQASYDNGTDGSYTGAAENSVYHHMTLEQKASSFDGIAAGDVAIFKDFLKAFFYGWRLNKEFGFNGLKEQPDWKVLEKTIKLFNSSHAPAKKIKIKPSNIAPVSPQTANPPKNMISYVAFLLHRYSQHFGDDAGLQDDGSIMLHGGTIHPINHPNLPPAGSIKLLNIHIQKPNGPLSPQVQKKHWGLGALIGGGIGFFLGGPAGAIAGAAAGAFVGENEFKTKQDNQSQAIKNILPPGISPQAAEALSNLAKSGKGIKTIKFK